VGDPAAFAALPPQEQQERQQSLQQTGDHLRSLLYLAGGTITTLATSTQEVAAPFLLPEMVERLAAMLNYFLLYLTGPERKKLKVRVHGGQAPVHCCLAAAQLLCVSSPSLQPRPAISHSRQWGQPARVPARCYAHSCGACCRSRMPKKSTASSPRSCWPRSAACTSTWRAPTGQAPGRAPSQQTSAATGPACLRRPAKWRASLGSWGKVSGTWVVQAAASQRGLLPCQGGRFGH
jgi:hypothetical protein